MGAWSVKVGIWESEGRILTRIKPMLFNTDMVKAILDGRKTVTRRICKDGNDFAVPDMDFYDADKRTYAVHNYANREHTEKLSIEERTCPICPGDILYVRETWAEWTGGYLYKAWNSPFAQPGRMPVMTWRPSIHMPKEAARIWLKVKDVRAEQLCSMKLDDFLSEGVCIRPEAFNDPENAHMQAKDEFIELWNSTISKGQQNLYGWTANPWVWAIEFEQCERPKR